MPDARACKNPEVWCKVCGRGYTESSLKFHAYEKHPGVKRADWYSALPVRLADLPDAIGAETDLAPEQAVGIINELDVDGPPLSAVPDLPKVHSAVVGRKSVEKDTVTSIYANLPWLTYPKSVAECDDALNLLAVAIEQADRALPFFLSLRAIATALRKRLAEGKAA